MFDIITLENFYKKCFFNKSKGGIFIKEEDLKNAVENHVDLINENYKEMYNNLGFENLLAFLNDYGGTILYVPTKKGVFADCLAEQIRKEFDGGNLRKLAIKYDLSERTLRNYVYANHRKKVE